jgi:hypothetical protein
MFYFQTYASVKTMEIEALSVRLLTFNPTFCCERKDWEQITFCRTLDALPKSIHRCFVIVMFYLTM